MCSDVGGALAGYAVVYFGNDWFAENRTSSHHIARRLSQRMPVLYVESPGQRLPSANARDLRKIYRKLADAAKPPQQLADTLWHLTMPQVPLRRLPLVDVINRRVGGVLVRRALNRLGFTKRISWFVAPDAGALAGTLGEDLSVYYVTDNYAAFPGVDKDQLARMDEDLARRVDQVFVSSDTLLEGKRAYNPSTVHSPHGVDVQHFARASAAATVIAPAAARLPHPVIGFFGLIEAWIDLDLVLFLARARPEWTFLMIGRLAVNAGELRAMPNVVFAGPQPYESLPEWAAAFDVAIIPYRQNQQVYNANPLKLREYLATGKPIVAVPTPEIARFADVVSIAPTHSDFLTAIETALTDNSNDRAAARRDAVSGMSWDDRVDDIVGVVARRLLSRNARQPHVASARFQND